MKHKVDDSLTVHVTNTSLSFKLLVVGVVAGALGLLGLRFALVKNDHVHYHANFALYVNGVRDEFKSFTFYEEIQACSSTNVDDPKTRVHMHDQNNHVIHVHDHAVTWSAFFANLGYGLTDNLVKTDQGVFVDGQDGKKLHFILNGQQVDSIADRVIADKDAMLISYGSEDQAALQKQYDSIPKDAAQEDKEVDPKSCSGNDSLTFKQRLEKALDIVH